MVHEGGILCYYIREELPIMLPKVIVPEGLK